MRHGFSIPGRAGMRPPGTARPPRWTAEARRALQTSLSRRQTALTRLLLSKHSVPPTLEGKTTPLLAQTLLDNDLDTCNELLAAGADSNVTLPAPPEKDFLNALPRH